MPPIEASIEIHDASNGPRCRLMPPSMAICSDDVMPTPIVTRMKIACIGRDSFPIGRLASRTGAILLNAVSDLVHAGRRSLRATLDLNTGPLLQRADDRGHVLGAVVLIVRLVEDLAGRLAGR